VCEGEIVQKHWGALVKGVPKGHRCNKPSDSKEILSRLLDVLAEDEYLDISEEIAGIQILNIRDRKRVLWVGHIILFYNFG